MEQAFTRRTTSQPQIEAFGLYLFPAWPLPLLVASTFLYLKTRQPQEREGYLAKAEKCLPYILPMLHIRTLYLVVSDANKLIGEQERRNNIIIVEFLALVTELSCTRPIAPYAAAVMALAWLELMSVLPEAHNHTKWQLGIAQLLSISILSGVPPGMDNTGLLTSGISLLTLTLGNTLSRDGQIQTVAVILALVGIAVGSRLLGLGLPYLARSLPQTWRTKLEGAFHLVCRVLAMLNIGAAGMYVTAYLWSCLGWQIVTDTGAPAQSPALSVFSLGGGGGLYSLLWILRWHWKGTRDPWRAEREHSFRTWTRSWTGLTVDTVGWTTTMFGLVYLLLYFIRERAMGTFPRADFAVL